MQKRNVPWPFIVVSVLLVGALCAVYIPVGIAEKVYNTVTLRRIETDRTRCFVFVGDSGSVAASLVPETAVTELTWSASDGSVIEPDGETGEFTAISAGETELTVTGSNGVSAAVRVTVLEKPLPEDSDYPPLYADRLTLANVRNPLPSDYVPELVSLPSKYPGNGMRMTPETLDAYEKMYADALAATGQKICVISSYRSFAKQSSLFEEDVAYFMARRYSREAAEKLAGATTQLPGCSEHQLGVSLDLSTDYGMSYNFQTTRLGSWVTQHAHEYGFILRYPDDKTELTGIDHESWHFRWVGVEHAEYIHGHGLCLEEYVRLQDEAAEAADEYAATISAESYYKQKYS